MRKFLAFLMALVMVMTLAACGAPAEPAATEFGGTTIKVSTVDEFLAALGPDRTIQLEPGHYDLTEASDYGKISENPYYCWRKGNWGCQLNMNNLRDLTIIGSGMEQTFLEGMPGNKILELINCENVTFCALAVGTWEELPETAYNAAFTLEACNGIKLEKMEVFGGCRGIEARGCQDLTVYSSRLDDLSGLADLYDCQGVTFRDCEIYNIGSETGTYYGILYNSGSDVTVEGGSISYCNTGALVDNDSENANTYIKGTLFQGNKVTESAFAAFNGTIILDNCSFVDNAVESWILRNVGWIEDANGNELNEWDFEQNFVEMPAEEDTPWQEITVSNIDEFLAALGSNRQIRLVPGTYNLQDASNYGQRPDSNFYVWEDCYDGYELRLKHVKNLTIVGSGIEQTFIETLPRSVAVLFLDTCKEITIRDVTMGHVETAEYCEGPVIHLWECSGIDLEGLGLYGCGTQGIFATRSSDLAVKNCHIYDCSVEGLYLYECDGVSITNCTIDRIGTPGMGGLSVLSANVCHGVLMDGCTVSDCVVDALISCWGAPESVTVKNTTFRNNSVLLVAFDLDESKNIVLDACTFGGNIVEAWYEYDRVKCVEDANGTLIAASDFAAMNG